MNKCTILGVMMLVLCGLCTQGQAGVLDGGNLSNHIYGPTINEQSIKGKVVFFEYWGIRCPPCIASLPHLVKLQNDLGKTGKFIVIGSHAQGMSDDVTKMLASKGVNYPVFQQLRLPHAPSAGGIPFAYLFDHTGAIVGKGHPSALYKQAEELVAKTPSPLLYGIKVKYCKSEVKKITKGKGWKSAMAALQKRVDGEGEDAQEAKLLLGNVNSYIKGQLDLGRAGLERNPTVAYADLRKLSKKLAGLPEGKEAKSLADKISKDKSFKRLRTMRAMIDKMGTKLNKKKNAKRRAGLEFQLLKLSKSSDAPKGVSAEAESLLQRFERSGK
jgi:thiol-disulfide isomerase/thioredoxin